MTITELLDVHTVTRCLAAGGLRPEASARQAARFVQVAQVLQKEGVSTDQSAYAFFVPGRIEVLGKHTDYAGGHSLICAVERGFCLIAVPVPGAVLHLMPVDIGEAVDVPLDPGLVPRPGHWSNYPMTVVRRVVRNFPGALQGGYLAFSSDLPQASGMSSSSALVVGCFLALSALNDLPNHPAYPQPISSKEALAQYLGCIENGQTFGTLDGDRGVGTFGGSEDHTAILCSEPGRLRRYAYAPTRFVQDVAMPAGYVFVIGSSGVVAQKTGAAQASYNRAARLAMAATVAWQADTGCDDPHLGAAVAAPSFTHERMVQALYKGGSGFTGRELVDRFEHFYTEHHRIMPPAVQALQDADLKAFGVFADRSQRAAEISLNNQIEETIFLASQARALGAVAASAFGAGFGGSVWAMVRDEDAKDFITAWSKQYAAAFPEPASRATFFRDQPGPAAFRLDVRRTV